MTDTPITNRDELIKKLAGIQNKPAFSDVDILSITGAMDDDYLEKYVQDKEREAAEYSTKRGPFVTGQKNSKLIHYQESRPTM
jgi:hypothetical protein